MATVAESLIILLWLVMQRMLWNYTERKRLATRRVAFGITEAGSGRLKQTVFPPILEKGSAGLYWARQTARSESVDLGLHSLIRKRDYGVLVNAYTLET